VQKQQQGQQRRIGQQFSFCKLRVEDEVEADKQLVDEVDL
jgi:hypothetical protein